MVNAPSETIDQVVACRFSRPRLKRLLGDFPALEDRLLDVASGELAAAQDQMLLLGRKTARERLASFLLLQAVPLCGQLKTRVELPMSRADIADYLGLTIETVSRTFSRLKSEGLIALHNATEVVILDPEKLRILASAEENNKPPCSTRPGFTVTRLADAAGED